MKRFLAFALLLCIHSSYGMEEFPPQATSLEHICSRIQEGKIADCESYLCLEDHPFLQMSPSVNEHKQENVSTIITAIKKRTILIEQQLSEGKRFVSTPFYIGGAVLLTAKSISLLSSEGCDHGMCNKIRGFLAAGLLGATAYCVASGPLHDYSEHKRHREVNTLSAVLRYLEGLQTTGQSDSVQTESDREALSIYPMDQLTEISNASAPENNS